MQEYERDGNVNTPEHWDIAWTRRRDETDRDSSIQERAAEVLEGLPMARVVEYGFGNTSLAELVGRDRWEGRDFSKVAVDRARAAGFRAHVTRCGDSPGYRKAYVVALQVLEHLDEAEMLSFLSKSRNAPHAVFSVPLVSPTRDVQKHMRGWRTIESFREFLRKWWPIVDVVRVKHRMVAHAMKARAPVAPVLTIGSSTLLDFKGVRYTLASLQTHHGTFGGRVEHAIVDNHPPPTRRLTRCPECAKIKKDGPVCATCTKNLKDMEAITHGFGARYIRWDDKQGTYPGKNQLKIEALGKWVLTMDSHVLLTPRTVETILDYIDANPDSNDFHHVPCLYWSDSGRPVAIDYRNQDFIYRSGGKKKTGGVYGWTGNAKTAGDPYPIAAMITSCYFLRKKAWFSAHGYDPILGNYGGWEGPLQLKFWLMGRRVLQMRHQDQRRIDESPHGFLYHDHLFCKPGSRLANQTGRFHTGLSKQRNFAASSAVIGGESWVRRHCELKGWNFDGANIQEGMAAGLKLRPWMIENLGRPEWEDITEFFAWMKSEEIPGALSIWGAV